jgi:glutamine amidotransferase
LERVGAEVTLSSKSADVLNADGLLVPGVGAFAAVMQGLKDVDALRMIGRRVAGGRPVLGICVGLQVLFHHSEENDTPCLGILPGRVRLFPLDICTPTGEPLKIPHMGWNEVKFSGHHPVFEGIPVRSEFYFVHSFYPEPTDDTHIVGRTDYGMEFASAVARRNLVAVQFHPEKSGPPGLRILDNFTRWDGRFAS